MARHGDSFNRRYSRYGFGIPVGGLAKWTPVKFNNFQAGIVNSDQATDVPENAATDMLDFEVGRKDELTTVFATLEQSLPAPLGPFMPLSARQIASFVPMDHGVRAIVFAAPSAYQYRPDVPSWELISGDVTYRPGYPYSWTTFADTLIFGNGDPIIPTKSWNADGVIANEPLIPNANAYGAAAARLFVGGFRVGGVYYPMVIGWSGPANYNAMDFATDEGAGYEPLVADNPHGDEIMAIRPMGLDVVAIICHKSIWIGRRTGDLDRPLDLQPRVMGQGAVSKSTVQSVNGGVLYLSDSGVELFDGNVSRKVSEAIDPRILPIDYSLIDEYSSSYDSARQRYQLHTPTGTYVFDLQSARWWRTGLIALGGVPIAMRLDNFDSQMLYLMRDNDGDPVLGRDFRGSTGHSNLPWMPRFESKLMDGDYINRLVSIRQITFRFKTAAFSPHTLRFTLLDENGEFTKVQPLITLPDNSPVAVMKQSANTTGRGLGFRLEAPDGIPRIYEVELLARVRGRRITADQGEI